jgi:hypothetical protein
MQNIKQAKGFNSFTWQNLTEGKLMMLARICKAKSESDALANDCYHDILNFYYEHDKPTYEYIKKNA